MPTRRFWVAGLRIDPDVSVLTPTFERFAGTVMPGPELETAVAIAGRPSWNSCLGAVRGSNVFDQVHEAVELCTAMIVGRDPCEVHANELLGGERPRTKSIVNAGDGGFDQVKPVAVPGVRDARQNDCGNSKENPGG